jgi:phospholipid N-methyltransferase
MEILNKYYKIALSVYKTELTEAEYKSAYSSVKSAEIEIKAELKTKTVKILKSISSQLGNWARGDEKKDDLINKVFDSLTDYFLIGRPVSYFLGEGNHVTVKENLILKTTQEDLNKFYTERKAKKEAEEKTLNNPETLGEFREFVRLKGKEALTPEQLIKYEQLTADFTLSRQAKEQEQNNTVSKINIENVEFEIYPTKHSKTQEDVFTVLMLNRVSAEDFKTLSTKAKKLGGYYSRYTDRNATPPIKAGFNFKTEAEAVAFIGLKEKDQTAAPQAEERAEEVKQSAGERMKERAEAMIAKAEEDLNRDRKTNTRRQARQASSSEDKARAEIVFAKKLILIAEGLENNTIKYLHAIRNGKQLEQLQSILNQGFYKRQRVENKSYSERQKEEKNPFVDVDFIEYPFPTYGENVINDILKNYSDKSGMIKDVKNILDYCRRNKNTNGLVIFKNLSEIELLKSTALKIRDEWEKNRILESIKNFERVQKMGLTNEAILKTALREFASLTGSAKITPEQRQEIELKELERSFISKKIDGFFPTPKLLIDRMFSMAKVFDNETILEPSAGLGHIAEAIKQKYPENNLHLVEYNSSLSEVLTKKGFNVQNDDFLNTSQKYDVVFMNPPFEKNQDIDHVQHAFSLLNDGGRLVAIMAGNKHENSNNKKIIEFLEMVEEFGYIQQNEEGSFKNAFNSTNVNTITVYLEKPVKAEFDEAQAHLEAQESNNKPAEILCNSNKGEQLTFF